MRTPKEIILSLISRELRAEAKLREDAENKMTAYKTMLDHALQFVGEIDFWRRESDRKHHLYADIVREVDGAEDLHQLKQDVRRMAFHEEYGGIIVKVPGEDPKVVVTNERII